MKTSFVSVLRLTSSLAAGLAMLLALFFVVGCGQVSEEQAHERELVAGGRASYRAYCAGCHGLEAAGDGPAASAMRIPPSDLTMISQRHGGAFPAEYVKQKIDGQNAPDTTSGPQMLHFGEIWRGTDPTPERREEVRQMIEEVTTYLASIQQ